jgi:hypothetical protein
MDVNKLRTEVFAKTGIKIDTNDPIFALVALNEAVLSEYVDPHIAGLHTAGEQLQLQTAQLLEAGERYRRLLQQMGKTVEESPAPMVDAPAPSAEIVPEPPLYGLPTNPLFVAVAIAVASAVLTLSGQALFGYNRPVSKVTPTSQTMPIAIQQALTPEQVHLIETGQKYAKIIPKLDAKTQARIQALLQQP